MAAPSSAVAAGLFWGVGSDTVDRGGSNSSFIATSLDGKVWTKLYAQPRGGKLVGLARGTDRFVAVGEGTILLSKDEGRTWRDVPFGFENWASAQTLRDVAFGDGLFVAVGGGEAITTSPDGETWTTWGAGATGAPAVTDPQTIRRAVTFKAVRFFGGKFFLVGSEARVTVMSVKDGKLVLESTVANSRRLPPVSFTDIAWDGDKTLVAVGSLNEDRFVSKDFGRTWTPIEALRQADGVGFGNGVFVAAGTFGFLATSKDGSTWVESPDLGRGVGLLDVAFGGGTFVATGADGARYVSPDGWTWTNVSQKAGEGRFSVRRLLFVTP
ncbi:WD40/YVTN/BNR-like repeat-containing protein [Deinococcus yavapaiensis]|uniref:Photosynthesis system II assembly factor YCF48-like protein n=1 Tax=Deinococcus yavapaiensis KR-236 TaxID=694435 RepID=A0A318S4V7_9DEIO|nr:hypothetical protein [Deinococcus yavapaiensis]PYE50503.1 hypothetical protein DES52_11721 [Deinococcus yavapaiensis KR-236]